MQAQEVSPPPPPDLRVPVAPSVQEIPIRPLAVKLPPERIVERTIVEREPRTEPLPVAPISIQVPPAPAPHITVNVPPERNLHEPNERVRTKDVPIDDTPYSKAERIAAPETNISPVAQPPTEYPEPEQKTLAPEPEKRSPDEPQNVPPANKKRSENNSPNNSETIPSRIDPELFTPDTPASQADLPEFEKIGPGRQRRYEELGKDDVEPIRELVLFRNEFGRHWPGLSRDMEAYYERFYFTTPNKRKEGKDYDKHVKCWERRTKWLAATESAPDSQ
jgi:hypothetical protein